MSKCLFNCKMAAIDFSLYTIFCTVWENTTVPFIYIFLILLLRIRNVSNIWIWYGKRRSFCIKYSSAHVPFPATFFIFILHWIKLNEVWSNLKLLLVENIYKKSIIHQKHHYYDTVDSLVCPASAISTTLFSSPFAKITINSWWFETLYSNPSRLLPLIVSLGMGTKEKKTHDKCNTKDGEVL